MCFLIQGSRVRENLPAGVLLADRSLVLQSVSRDQAGSYVCGAANKLGETESAPLLLNVRCKNTDSIRQYERVAFEELYAWL